MSVSAVNLREKRGLFVLPRLTDPELDELAAVFSFVRAGRFLGGEKKVYFSSIKSSWAESVHAARAR